VIEGERKREGEREGGRRREGERGERKREGEMATSTKML
jgi:hypothetical protein